MPDFDITGIDNDEQMLDVARKRAPDANFYRAIASQLPFPNSSFDAIVFVTSLEFIEDYRLAIDEAVRILKSGILSSNVPIPQPTSRIFFLPANSNIKNFASLSISCFPNGVKQNVTYFLI